MICLAHQVAVFPKLKAEITKTHGRIFNLMKLMVHERYLKLNIVTSKVFYNICNYETDVLIDVTQE